MDGYATHLEALVTAALESEGDILELGCGSYSTPVLSAIAKHRGNKLVVNASDPVWANRYKEFAEIVIVDWKTWQPEGQWGMIFLDNEEHQPYRLMRVPKLLEHAPIVVMHDADQAEMSTEFSQITSGLNIKTYKTHQPWTMVFSRC